MDKASPINKCQKTYFYRILTSSFSFIPKKLPLTFSSLFSTEAEALRANELRKQLGLKSLQTHNTLIDLQQETGMDFQLPTRPGKNKKIELLSPYPK